MGLALGQELDERVTIVGRELAETLEQKMELLEIFGIERGGIGRNHREQGLHEAAHGNHHLGEFVVGLGVEAGMSTNVADGFGVIVYAPQVIAVGHGRKCAVEREDFQAVMRKIEFANDLGAEERDNISAVGKKEDGEDVLG